MEGASPPSGGKNTEKKFSMKYLSLYYKTYGQYEPVHMGKLIWASPSLDGSAHMGQPIWVFK